MSSMTQEQQEKMLADVVSAMHQDPCPDGVLKLRVLTAASCIFITPEKAKQLERDLRLLPMKDMLGEVSELEKLGAQLLFANAGLTTKVGR